MSVSQQTPFNTYTGNGVTTQFFFNFKLLAAADLQVWVAGALKVLNVDYSVAGLGVDVGGSITFLTGAPGNGVSVALIRRMKPTRSTDYQNQGDFLASIVNPDFDRAILLLQDMDTQLGRSIRTPEDEVGTLPTLPSKASRSGKFISFDANGQPTGSVGTGNDAALRTDLAADAQGDVLVAVKYSALSAVALNLHDYIEDDGALNIMGFIAPGLKSAIRDHTSNADVSSAMQAWADAVADGSGNKLRLPRGRFVLAAPVNFTPKSLVQGAGHEATLIRCIPSAHSTQWLKNALATVGADGYITFRDFSLQLGDTATYHSQIGIDLRDRSGGGTEHSAKSEIERVIFQNWNLRAIHMDESFASHIDRCEFQSIQNLLYALVAGAAFPIFINGVGNGVTIRRCYFSSCDGILRVLNSSGTNAALTFAENTCDASANYANPSLAEHLFIEGAVSLSVLRNYFEGLRTGPSGGPGADALLRLKSVLAADISGNYFQGDLSGVDVTYRHVRVEPTCRNVVIEKNDFEDPTNAYIQVEAGAEDTIVRNNRYVFGGAAETTMAAVRSHITGTCLLENNDYAQTIAFAAAVTPDARAGRYIAIGALTGNLTINAPTNPPSQPGMPLDIFIELLQDGVGGRTVTLNAVFVSNYSNTGNTANTRNHGRFTWTGSQWRGAWTGWF